MTAVYQWSAPDTLELETVVKAHAELPRFEVFLASYFQTQFTNALVRAEAKSGFIRADPSSGDWQMFPRDQAAIDYITDGRWKLEPNPVEWTIRPRHTQAVALRRAPELGLAGILVAAPADCFAIAMPHETEGHYSVYLSLFGRDLGRGEIARARTGLIIAAGLSDSGIRERANAWLEGLARSRR
jgi:hypothetical protein